MATARRVFLRNRTQVVTERAPTEQEADEQYGMYEASVRSKIVVIPPGVDVSRFQPPRRGDGVAEPDGHEAQRERAEHDEGGDHETRDRQQQRQVPMMVGETGEHPHPRIVGERRQHEQGNEVAEDHQRTCRSGEEHAERERALAAFGAQECAGDRDQNPEAE